MKPVKSFMGLLAGMGLFFLMPGFAGVAVAAEGLSPAQQVIQLTSDQIQSSLQKPEYKADFRKAMQMVDQVINPHVDFDRVSILVLGKNWRTATPAQRERFKQEFRQLLVRTYTTAFTEYADWKIRYLPLDTEAAQGKVLVRTEVLQPGSQPVAVNYRMAQEGMDWKVYDILIEGISLLENYRNSFGSEVEQAGMDQLISRLAERNASALKEPLAGGRSGS